MSDIAKPLTEEEQTHEHAHQTLKHVTDLRRSIPFDLYFLEEPRRRTKEIEATLQHRMKQRKPMDEGERQFLLGQLDILQRWADKLDQDEAGSKSILSQ